MKNTTPENSEDETDVSIRAQRKVFHVWTWPLAAVLFVVAAMLIVNLLPAPTAGDSDRKVRSSSDIERMEEFFAVENGRRSGDNIVIPITAGKLSLTQITRSIREAGKLPNKKDVRIEEMLNAFPLEAKDSVALWQGNSLGVEVVQCPWSPSGSLIFVKIRGSSDRSSKLNVEFQSKEGSVISSHLIGYELEENDRERKPMPQNLSASQEILVALLVESKSPELGKLVWSVNGEAGPTVELARDAEKEASSDSQFASLICGFGLWLREEKSEMIDDALILGLAREVAAESLVADRYDFLELVDQAVKVKSK